MYTRICGFLFCLAIVPVPSHAGDLGKVPEQYICVANKMSGFEYKDDVKVWGPMHSRSDRKYLIQASSDPNARFEITEVEKNIPLGYCKEGFNSTSQLSCDLVGGELKFNKSNGRFVLSYLVGYYDVGSSPDLTDETSDMPFLEIGKCSQLNKQ